ncbi:MAG: PASTA domain-containing protein, partial [Chloroflexota bacterium]
MPRFRPVRPLPALVLVLAAAIALPPAAVAQEPGASALPVAWPVGPVRGAVLAPAEARTGLPARLRLGTALAGLALVGERAAFAPGELAALRLELPAAVDDTELRLQLWGTQDGALAAWAYPALPTDPSWDTLVARIPVPQPGDYRLRVLRGRTVLAETALAVRDVPRLAGLVHDPAGLLGGDPARVAAAQGRYADGTAGGWLWSAWVAGTGALPLATWIADLRAVNADQLDPRDALLVVSVAPRDADLAVGSEAGRAIVPAELAQVRADLFPELAAGRWIELLERAAEELVLFHGAGPVATPTPQPTPAPTPQLAPSFLGLGRTAAVALAARRGIELRITEREVTDAPRGTVLAQDPAPGAPIVPGRPVILVVAATPATVRVPDVVGLPEADALADLYRAGLRPGARTERTSLTVPLGDILRTDPAPGTELLPGSLVAYTVSSGRPAATPRPTPRPVLVPDVRDLPELDAITSLLDAGLVPGTRTVRPSRRIAAGHVIETDPAAGTLVRHAARIAYVVSSGPA